MKGFGGAGEGGFGGEAEMDAQGFGDLFADAEDRVEAGHRLLEDHGDTVAAEGLPVGVGEAGEITGRLAVRLEQDAPRLDPAGAARQQTEAGEGGDGFAGA